MGFPKLRQDEMPSRRAEWRCLLSDGRGEGLPAALPHPHLPSSGFPWRPGCPSLVLLPSFAQGVKLVPSSPSRVWDHWRWAWKAGVPLALSISQQVLK